MTTIKDVARAAGVSTATVSRTLSGKNPVSEEVRQKVLGAIDQLGYRPNALARSLREENTKTLGLVVGNVMNPFFTSIARAVEDTARASGYTIVLGNADEDPDKEEAYLKVLLEKRVDGLLISPARAESPHLAEIVAERVPVVFVDRSIEGINAPVVRADGRQAIMQMVDYLVNLGHKKLGIISGPPDTVSGSERLEVFLHAAAEYGVMVDEQHIRVGDFRRQSGQEAMEEFLKLRDPLTAVFAANNLMALGALQAIKAARLRVPEDISIVSFDDVTWFTLLEPTITAISQPSGELGNVAACMLLEMVEKGRRPESVVMDAELVIRESCAEPRRD